MQALQRLSVSQKNLSKEVAKVKTLAPSKYYISTSVGLTPANKEEILHMFKPFIKKQKIFLERKI